VNPSPSPAADVRGSILTAACFVLTNIPASANAQSGLQLSSTDGFWRFDLRPSAEFVYWHTDAPAPGLLSFTGTDFFEPRISLRFNAAAGEKWLLHVLTQWDRGFDPGSREDGDFRVDEVFLRWRPFGDATLNLQAGKFATSFGNWLPRHGFWDDPFLTPPLPYDELLAVNDRSARNPSATTIATRATGKRAWLPMIWGPNYTSGVSVFGSSAHWDYALEAKNAAINSRPDSWNPGEENFSHPTITGRIGYRPDAAWAFGISGSHGTYLRKDAEITLAGNERRADFAYTIVGADARWSHHQFQVLGEIMASRAHTTVAGDLDALSYYVEGRWKVNSTLFLAARWAQIWNEDFFADGLSGPRSYDRQISRVTAAAGFRITREVLVKAEYSYSGGDANENAVALGLGFRF
jgi:hypothetical protein